MIKPTNTNWYESFEESQRLNTEALARVEEMLKRHQELLEQLNPNKEDK